MIPYAGGTALAFSAADGPGERGIRGGIAMNPLTLLAAVAWLPAQEPLEPWASRTHPADAVRTHVEEIVRGRAEYRVTHGGTMDGENGRDPLGGGFGIWTQAWESNRSVRLENVGETDVIHPWLSNGRNDFRTIPEIVSKAVRPGMSDRERAIALWRQHTTRRFHAGAGDAAEMHDPVKVYNVYGYATCGDDAVCLAGLWNAAGFAVSPGRLLGHRTSQVFFDGRWNMLDGNQGAFYLLRDNTTLAAERDLARDHDLLRRGHPHGPLDPDVPAAREANAALYGYEGDAKPDRAVVDLLRRSTMDMVLRPGEAIVWRWGHATPLKYHGLADIRAWGPRTAHGRTWGAAAADRICNGLWEYRPDFRLESWRRGAESAEHVRVENGELAAAEGKTGTVVWRMRAPYVFVGGRLDVEGRGASFYLSWDGAAWRPAADGLDAFFPSDGPARYDYRLKCVLPPGARLRRLAIVNDLQMAPLALPGLVLGENRLTYTDDSPGARRVKITHAWAERSLHRPPAAPPSPIHPPDGGATDRTDVVFRWQAPAGAADYHFELSDRRDFAWPLSSNFERLTSRGEARYALPSAGLLTPGRGYFWRVRARSDEGLWSPWSPTWTFTAGGLAPPCDVRLEAGVLRWTGDASAWRVHGSDEKGFSTSGSTLVAETDRAELAVLGPGRSNKAFYRVVAVDDRGRCSGPSEAAAAPRPFFHETPPARAVRGVEYQGRVSTLRSLGDLQVRWIDGREVPGFWDVETPRYRLDEAPAWLWIDETTGELRGVPDVAGTFDAAVTVVLTRTRRLYDVMPRPWNLGWGKEKFLGVAEEDAGRETLRFRITVREGP